MTTEASVGSASAAGRVGSSLFRHARLLPPEAVGGGPSSPEERARGIVDELLRSSELIPTQCGGGVRLDPRRAYELCLEAIRAAVAEALAHDAGASA